MSERPSFLKLISPSETFRRKAPGQTYVDINKLPNPGTSGKDLFAALPRMYRVVLLSVVLRRRDNARTTSVA